ncbi:MAG: erythromycin esterase family protein [Peptoniphilus harei]|uniref:erythromycin esterase family protein n=1 Tax=Peptoniphilus harei TaxID=54005 RepID=UPI00290250F2|nr:erythromycin esterase family protein [Peptoniphilus harei]MDU2373344.1 erythromycin esterase family protein [Peptoniphilus harei]MDU5470879.1 erythromycin esterase family protein [Peptoniphilus harei]MDU6098794.1 erythromycin esterase family protein [Peptoniphilus harei]
MIKKIFKGILIFLVSLIILIGIGDFLWINLPKLSARKNISDIEEYGKEVSQIKLDDNVRLVGLGEGTHGNSDFQDLKLEVLKTLVEKNNLKNFAIEADFGEGMMINNYIHGNKRDENISRILSFNIYHTKNMNYLINYMFDYNQKAKDEDKLSFYGFDMQNPEKSIELILDFCKENNILQERDLQKEFSFIKDEKFKISQLKDKEDLLLEIKAHTDTLSSPHAKILSRALTNVLDSVKYYELDFDDYVKVNNVRDELMAKNVKWISDFEKSKGNKMLLISGHNGHIAKSEKFYEPMGSHLKKIFGEKYFIIGTDFYKGIVNINEAGPDNKRSNHAFVSADPLAYSARKFEGKYYLDFTKVKDGETFDLINKEINMVSLGEGYSPLMKFMPRTYRVKEVPKDLYDAMIFVYYAKPIAVND